MSACVVSGDEANVNDDGTHTHTNTYYWFVLFGWITEPVPKGPIQRKGSYTNNSLSWKGRHTESFSHTLSLARVCVGCVYLALILEGFDDNGCDAPLALPQEYQ